MSTQIERRLEKLEARTAHAAVMPTLLITAGADIEAAWRAQHPTQRFPGVENVFTIVLRGVRPLERRDDGV